MATNLESTDQGIPFDVNPSPFPPFRNIVSHQMLHSNQWLLGCPSVDCFFFLFFFPFFFFLATWLLVPILLPSEEKEGEGEENEEERKGSTLGSTGG